MTILKVGNLSPLDQNNLMTGEILCDFPMAMLYFTECSAV
jgi:hypothetical protein